MLYAVAAVLLVFFVSLLFARWHRQCAEECPEGFGSRRPVKDSSSKEVVSIEVEAESTDPPYILVVRSRCTGAILYVRSDSTLPPEAKEPRKVRRIRSRATDAELLAHYKQTEHFKNRPESERSDYQEPEEVNPETGRLH